MIVGVRNEAILVKKFGSSGDQMHDLLSTKRAGGIVISLSDFYLFVNLLLSRQGNGEDLLHRGSSFSFVSFLGLFRDILHAVSSSFSGRSFSFLFLLRPFRGT